MKKQTWKRILLINSCFWVIAATYCVYATTYGVLSLDWKRFLYGILVLVFFSILQATIAIAGD